VLAAAALAGCGEKDEPERSAAPAAPTSEAQSEARPKDPSDPRPVPVAYALDASTLRNAPADLAVIERRGRAVASTEWDGFVGTTAAYYAEEHGVPLFDPPASFKPLVDKLANEGLNMLILDESDRRRYAERLARLRPPVDELASYYEEFHEEAIPDAGRAMLDWFRVLRESLARARGRTVVVVSLVD
jgi:hypothetical protein